MNFATLKGLTIPEGVVTQIADASGRVLWKLSGGKVILEVEKITSTTYVSSTSYTDEQFLMLDIYPKTSSSTVDVTYGGLTKTLTFSGTNAQQVYFGTYGGVADSVTTPASGTLTIEGGCAAFAVGSFNSAKNVTKRCSCVTAIKEFGGMKEIPNSAFSLCKKLTTVSIPDDITAIGSSAFSNCTNLAISELPDSIKTIGSSAFYQCLKITINKLPSGVTEIGGSTFFSCYSIANFNLHEGIERIGRSAFLMETESTKLMNGEITLPSSLKSIGGGAFMCHYRVDSTTAYQGSYLSVVNVLATTPPTFEDYDESSDTYYLPFGEPTSTYFDSNFVIRVPSGCGSVYKATTGWSEYADYIVEAS